MLIIEGIYEMFTRPQTLIGFKTFVYVLTKQGRLSPFVNWGNLGPKRLDYLFKDKVMTYFQIYSPSSNCSSPIQAKDWRIFLWKGYNRWFLLWGISSSWKGKCSAKNKLLRPPVQKGLHSPDKRLKDPALSSPKGKI